MKIAFIAIKGVNTIGGIETYTLELGKQLVKAGHEVIVYCMKENASQNTYMMDGIRFYPLPTIRHKYLAKMVVVFLASLHQIKLTDLDVVHYQAVGPSIFSFIPRLMGRYTVFQSHGHEWERDSWNGCARQFFKLAEKLTFLFVNDASAVSKNLTHYYKNKYQKEVTYIPSGVTPRSPLELKKNLKHKVRSLGYILYVGRLSKEKRIDDLIQAYTQLENKQIKLVIVGKERPDDQHYARHLKQLAAQHADILFTGPAYGDELAEWYSNALVYVLPSAIEGLPITLLEAMSFSRCCIASDIPANTEALANKGITYPLGDIKALQQALQQVIDHPNQTTTTGHKLADHVLSHYTWSEIADSFIQFYEKHRQQTSPIEYSQRH